MTYTTPSVNRNGGFRGDLSPLGVTIDASGGWWDAGDYLKFLHATTYADSLLLTGVRDFPAQMGAGGAADFTAEAKFGADWILRMWDDPSRTLYYQVGIGGGNGKTVSDHDIWRLPQADDTFGGTDPLYRYIRNRPVFRAGPPGSLDQPEPRRAHVRRPRARLPGLPDERPGVREQGPRRRGPHLRPREHEPGPADDRDPVRVLPRDRVARRPRAGRRRAPQGAGRRGRRAAGRAAPHGPGVLPRSRGDVGERLHHRPERRGRHAEPLRRQRARPLRARPGDRPRPATRPASRRPTPHSAAT